jgi:hypothetical protein
MKALPCHFDEGEVLKNKNLILKKISPSGRYDKARLISSTTTFSSDTWYLVHSTSYFPISYLLLLRTSLSPIQPILKFPDFFSADQNVVVGTVGQFDF